MRVLVVEEDRSRARQASIALAAENLDVDLAATSLWALQIVRDHSRELHVAIVDVDLSDTQELLEELARVRPDVAVVLATAAAEHPPRGCSALLRKPYTMTTLLAAVQTALALRSVRHLDDSRMTSAGFCGPVGIDDTHLR